MENKFVIGVDLDGVVADYFNSIRPVAAKWLGVPEANLANEIDYDFRSWGSENWPGGFLSLHRYAVVKERLFDTMPPIAGAAQTLRKLSEDGFRIRIITYRLCMKYHHATAITQTVNWLEKHDIPYWDLCFMADKAAVDADVYIDDSPSNFKRLEEAGKRVWLYRQGWNKQVETPNVVHNWKEIYDGLIKARAQ
jgi:5'(3')-deoxyribonucleotidase